STGLPLFPYTTLFRSPAVARAVGIEVGQECGLPSSQGLPEPRDLGDRAGRQRSDQLLGQSTTPGRSGLVEHVAEVLGALVGDPRSEEHTSELQSRFDI